MTIPVFEINQEIEHVLSHVDEYVKLLTEPGKPIPSLDELKGRITTYAFDLLFKSFSLDQVPDVVVETSPRGELYYYIQKMPNEESEWN